MKTIHVVAAVIRQGEKILATQRGYGDFKGGWEFPGGKVEAGETPEAAIVREIREELAVTIAPDEFLMRVEYDYPTFHLSMDCFMAHVVKGEIALLEHQDGRWLKADEMNSVDWLPADIDVAAKVKAVLLASRQ